MQLRGLLSFVFLAEGLVNGLFEHAVPGVRMSQKVSHKASAHAPLGNLLRFRTQTKRTKRTKAHTEATTGTKPTLTSSGGDKFIPNDTASAPMPYADANVPGVGTPFGDGMPYANGLGMQVGPFQGGSYGANPSPPYNGRYADGSVGGTAGRPGQPILGAHGGTELAPVFPPVL